MTPLLGVLLACAGSAFAKSAVDKLAQQLPAAPFARKVEIIERLGRSKDRHAVPVLLSLFDVKNAAPELSLALARSLGELGDPRAEDALTGAWDYLNGVRLGLGDDGMPPRLVALRETVAGALGGVGGERGAEILLEALSDDDPVVVENAARGLGRLRDKRAVDPLLDLLSRRGPVGQSAYEALADIGDSRAVPRLEAALKTGDPVLEAEAAYALSRIRNQASDKLSLNALMLNEGLDPEARALAAYYLMKLGRKVAFDFLGRWLSGGSPAEQALAERTLGQSGSARAVAVLVKALGKADTPLKLSIIPQLQRLGGAKAASALKKLEQDNLMAVRQAARQALAGMQP